MKYLAIILAGILVIGCQTTDTAVVSAAKSVEVSKLKKPEVTKPIIDKAFQTTKPILCAPSSVVSKKLKKLKETAFAVWKSAINNFPVAMFVDQRQKTLTILEYVGNGFVCFLSIGENIYIKEDNIHSNYKLWK